MKFNFKRKKKFKKWKPVPDLPKWNYLCEGCFEVTKKRNGKWVLHKFKHYIRPVKKIKKGGLTFEVRVQRQVTWMKWYGFWCKSCIEKEVI